VPTADLPAAGPLSASAVMAMPARGVLSVMVVTWWRFLL
jgi:hypothetical protein